MPIEQNGRSVCLISLLDLFIFFRVSLPIDDRLADNLSGSSGGTSGSVPRLTQEALHGKTSWPFLISARFLNSREFPNRSD